MTETDHIWYVGYGSNLLRERFNHYILGDQFRLGGSTATGCSDKTLPLEDKPITIPYEMFFAKESKSWGNGGVAFISTKKDENKQTYARMWEITEEQFSEIWKQEGKGWYDEKIKLGVDEKGIPILTITSSSDLKPTKPSKEYLKTIVMGLKETYHIDNHTIWKYLSEMSGVKDKWDKVEFDNLLADV